MGSSTGLCLLQPGGCSLLHSLLFPLPSSTPEIRSPVSVVDSSSCKPHARQIVPATNEDLWDQLDCGVCLIPHILGGTSGSAHICHAPSFYPAAPIYSCIFRVYSVDSVLLSGGMFIQTLFPAALSPSLYITGSICPRELYVLGLTFESGKIGDSHFFRCPRPTYCAGVVPRILFPHGLNRYCPNVFPRQTGCLKQN